MQALNEIPLDIAVIAGLLTQDELDIKPTAGGVAQQVSNVSTSSSSLKEEEKTTTSEPLVDHVTVKQEDIQPTTTTTNEHSESTDLDLTTLAAAHNLEIISDSESSDEESSDSSSDSSSSEDSGPHPTTTLEQLLESSDEEGGKAGTSNALPSTKHEIIAPQVVLPSITEVSPDELIEPIGEVATIVDSVVVVRAYDHGMIRVLDTDSLLVFEDRKVLGQIFETFGPLTKPLYSLRFPSALEVEQRNITVGRKVFFCPTKSTFAYTSALLLNKGNDASNLWDEEVAEEEVEFSDDEKEAEWKRRTGKRRKRAGSVSSNASRKAPKIEEDRMDVLPYDDDQYMDTSQSYEDPYSDAMLEAASISHERPYRPRGRGRGSRNSFQRPPNAGYHDQQQFNLGMGYNIGYSPLQPQNNAVFGLPPSPIMAPPPGAHINPLFAMQYTAGFNAAPPGMAYPPGSMPPPSFPPQRFPYNQGGNNPQGP